MVNNIKDLKLAIIGLGYVGLPLALEFAKKREVICFDINKKRIEELNRGIDKNLEFNKEELRKLKQLNFTNIRENLSSANCFIITVPTPIDKFKRPNLSPLSKATKMIGKIIKKGDLIIYESTVYPGCVEEFCVPILEKFSKLIFNKDFFCGYSPERINPGDSKHTISKITKITSGSTPKILDLVDKLYNEIITVGTHRVPSIQIAEAAKVIENTQRDLNIALINELSIIFNKMNIDTHLVLEAAETKWNFFPFKPGLVGGHCIGVDPYYLTYKAKKIGYLSRVILAGREVNDNMGEYVALELKKKMNAKKIQTKKAKILIMGLTFKENCSDCRNSGIKTVVGQLKKFQCHLDLQDPYADREEIKKIYDIYPISKPGKKKYDAVIISVAHKEFKKLSLQKIKNFCKKKHVIFDLKNLFNSSKVDFRL